MAKDEYDRSLAKLVELEYDDKALLKLRPGKKLLVEYVLPTGWCP